LGLTEVTVRLLTAFGAEVETGVLTTILVLGLELEPSLRVVADFTVGLGLEETTGLAGVEVGVVSVVIGVESDTGAGVSVF
jgi:hypothetical protein